MPDLRNEKTSCFSFVFSFVTPRIFLVVQSNQDCVTRQMSALFDFQSFLIVVLLFVCSCTYIKLVRPAIFKEKTGYVVYLRVPETVVRQLCNSWCVMGT